MYKVNIVNSGYHLKRFDSDIELVCYTNPGEDPTQNWRICLSDEALEPHMSILVTLDAIVTSQICTDSIILI